MEYKLVNLHKQTKILNSTNLLLETFLGEV